LSTISKIQTEADEKAFMECFKREGAAPTARTFGMTERTAYKIRDKLRTKYNRDIPAPRSVPADPAKGRIKIEVPDGVVLVGGDAHYWPGPATLMHRAFVKFAKEMKPKALIMNGDAFDGAAISRHASIGWEDQPSVAEELEAVQERLHEIELATPRGCKLYWPAGNHDLRFETRLATVAPEFKHLKGFHLKDLFPAWSPCWSVWINDSVVVKHRYKGGVHATHNNTVAAGMTMVTNHLHSAKVTPYDDYRGTRYGVDTGCLADPYGPQFQDYSEDNPRNHRAGFAVLSFRDGELLPPELVTKWDDRTVVFRGQLMRV
jgi:hypothetical protein